MMVHTPGGEPLISRSLALTLAGLLVTQILAAVWWASSVNSKLEGVGDNMRQLRAESYTRVEAALQVQRLDQQITSNAMRIGEVAGQVAAAQRETTQRRSEAQNERYPRAITMPRETREADRAMRPQ